MADGSNLPNIKIGSDAAKDPAFDGDGTEPETATIEYIDFEVLKERGWSTDDENLFEKARASNLAEHRYGELEISKNDRLLDGVEAKGQEWPFSCRAAGCANCACILVDGELDMEMNLIMTDEEVDEKGIRLSCQSKARTDHVQIISNAKHLDYLQDRVIGVREV